MTPLLALAAAALPCLLWTQGPDTADALKAAGVPRICVPAADAASWRATGLPVTPMTPADLGGREPLLPPGVAPRVGVASPTRAPWVNTNGARVRRDPRKAYVCDPQPGRAALAAAEAFAYGADVVLKIDPADLPAAGRMLAFLATIPRTDLPDVADIGVIDDGSPIAGEVMNLLTRRNLLFAREKSPSPRYRVNVRLGTPAYPLEEAADPSAFALKVRHELTDERRSVRLYGSEVVIARLTSDGRRARLHLLNYGGRPIEGLRVRVRGALAAGAAYGSETETGRLTLEELTVTKDGATEFTIPQLNTYAVIDLSAAGAAKARSSR